MARRLGLWTVCRAATPPLMPPLLMPPLLMPPRLVIINAARSTLTSLGSSTRRPLQTAHLSTANHESKQPAAHRPSKQPTANRETTQTTANREASSTTANRPSKQSIANGWSKKSTAHCPSKQSIAIRPNKAANRTVQARNRHPSAMVAQDFEAVLEGKYPAKAHARRVVDLLRSKMPDATGVLYLEGRRTKLQEDNDSPEHFRYARRSGLTCRP